jgi:magnesium transporter
MAYSAPLFIEELEAQVRHTLDSGKLDILRDLLAAQHPADLADIIERLDDEQRHQVFELLPPEHAAEVLDEVGGEVTRDLLEELPTEKAGDLLELMAVDDAAEILSEDVPELQQELLTVMEKDEAAEVRNLLQYPPHSAGRLMTDKFVRVWAEMTPMEILSYLRQVDAEVETVNDVYALDGNGKLIGIASLRDVITAPVDSHLRDFMTTQIITVTPETDQEEVARLVERYDFLAIPVVAPDGKMFGIVTVDDIIDVLVHESTEDVMRFAGIEANGTMDQPYFTIPILRVLRKRFGWLLMLFLAETLTGSVLRIFESELATVVALSLFIPLLIGTGGNTGAQTVSTIIRGLALKEIRLRDTWRVIVREFWSGALLGLALGSVGFVRTLLWGETFRLALVVGFTILAICTWANTIGSLIPLVAQKFKIDPAVVSAPLITTLVDATGLAIYMLIAKVILGL